MSDVFHSEYMKESESSFICPDGALIVGREHIGDENGKTQYSFKKLYGRKKGDEKWVLCRLRSDMK